jgi:hypothetical protein
MLGHNRHSSQHGAEENVGCARKKAIRDNPASARTAARKPASRDLPGGENKFSTQVNKYHAFSSRLSAVA